ncbi:hypothetical protein QQS45_06690 [Alteriqipengyuania flavescens]|uniref:hypothetical protein n=1 Tax=Alteriqipengyuania flavescens TaxID=3053610 RepID=UPI0025B2FB6F|nr:hypothetical protein [Alteriqipengyuania flavescens]WJY25837.1 hypothetical protein QQS45_06690 [Alteriqipengyuania flavescens]
MPLRDVEYVLQKLNSMRAEKIWPNGLRYLWTDAFGVILMKLPSPFRLAKLRRWESFVIWSERRLA